jgi:hypothetical protein
MHARTHKRRTEKEEEKELTFRQEHYCKQTLHTAVVEETVAAVAS